jgi:hypothetical protein
MVSLLVDGVPQVRSRLANPRQQISSDQDARRTKHLPGELPEVAEGALGSLLMPTERTVRRREREHRLPRFLGHRHQARVAPELGETVLVFFDPRYDTATLV